jgi:hypothetical protein
MCDKYNNENNYQKYCKCFHEVIIDSKIVKLYMDFDFSFSSECHYNTFNEQKFFNYVFDGLDKQFKYYGIELKFSYDIMVMASHKDKVKRSYHIVVCKYGFESKNNVQYLVKKINDELPEQYKCNMQIYSSNHCFRMLFSYKLCKDRYFNVIPFKYKNIECILPITNHELNKVNEFAKNNIEKEYIINKILFCNSLVTNYVLNYNSCDTIKPTYISAPVKVVNYSDNMELFNELPDEIKSEIKDIIKNRINGWAIFSHKQKMVI